MDVNITELKIAVLCAGPGAEREVSINSGREVTSSLKQAGLNPEYIEIDGNPTEIAKLKCDIAFLALHGEFGEDGTIQRLLDQEGIAYTGSGAKASKLAMDKHASKLRFHEQGIPTPDWATVSSADDALEAMRATELKFPVIVKPNSLGSSVYIEIVKSANRLESAVTEALAHDKIAMIEEYVKGRELTVGVFEDKALPIIELSTAREFYDYQAKYLDDNTIYKCPAPLDEITAEATKFFGLGAAHALDVEHFGRTDLILGSNGLTVLEVNTIPGFTSHSLLPKAARQNGIEMPQLCTRIIELAWQRHLSTLDGARVAGEGYS